jgi:glycosyltransferase involved in cell wall biosynthesis
MSKKFTIGIDASRANTANRTGVEEYVFQVCKYLSLQVLKYPDLEIVLYTREPLIPEFAEVLSEHLEVKILKWLPERLWTQIRLSWEMLVNPPNILFVPGHVFPIIHPKETIMTIHDVAAKEFPESYNLFERWYSLWSAKVAVNKLWKVIAISEFTKLEIGKRMTDSDKISVIPLAYDKKYKIIEDSAAIDQALKKYNIEKPFLLSVGRLETKKNTVRLIQAFNKLKSNHQSLITNYQLVLVGGKGHGYEKAIKEIEKSPYKNDIILPGYVEDADLPYIMNAAEVFVFPSLYEGFGIPILEAFACGTPVVTSNTTSCREVAGKAAVLIDPLDVESIASGVEKAINGETVEYGLDRAEEYSWEQTVQKIFNVIL